MVGVPDLEEREEARPGPVEAGVGLVGLGFDEEAQTAAAILGYNYQASPFYDDTFRLLKGKGLSPEARGERKAAPRAKARPTTSRPPTSGSPWSTGSPTTGAS